MKITMPRYRRKRRGAWPAGLFCLLLLLTSGCTVLHNSASFYDGIPRRPINWREYTSD